MVAILKNNSRIVWYLEITSRFYAIGSGVCLVLAEIYAMYGQIFYALILFSWWFVSLVLWFVLSEIQDLLIYARR